jgi:hypothetical protein
MGELKPPKVTKAVAATTVMPAVLSFWRAAAIVLCGLGSSSCHAGGPAEGFAGKPAPWFVLVITLFSCAVRAVYIESRSMFVRGGVYRVVRQALGGSPAKFPVSALMFDYILTGPVSGVRGRPSSGGADRRNRRPPSFSRLQSPSVLFCRSFDHRHHTLFLAQKHHRTCGTDQFDGKVPSRRPALLRQRFIHLCII